MMKVADAIKKNHAWLTEHSDQTKKILDDIYRRQTELDIRYSNRTIPTFLRPCFISNAQRQEICNSSQILLGCAERFIEHYVKDETARTAIGLTEQEEKFALMDSGLQRNVVVARPDSFMFGDSLKYLEFNSDSPAGVAWTDLHEQVFLELPHMRELSREQPLGTSSCQQLMMEAFLAAYKESGLSAQPALAIIDWREGATGREFYVIRDYYKRHGIEAVVADPREMELRGTTLYAAGTPVSMVYRRVIIQELLEKKDEKGISDFLKAYQQKLVCVVNPFSAKISGSKAFMAVLSDPQYEKYFNNQQNEIKRTYVPWTRVLKESQAEYRDRQTELFEIVRTERERMVIKPTNGYGGKGVVIGRETNQSEWDSMIEQAANKPGAMTAQEYVQIPEEEFPFLEPEFHFEKLKVNLNPYLFGGKYAGSFVRLSKSSIINVTQGGEMVPIFVLG